MAKKPKRGEGMWDTVTEEDFVNESNIVDEDIAEYNKYGMGVFSANVNLARHIGVDAESALRAATAKFAKRFRAVEARVKAAGKEKKAMSLSELDAVWDAVKAEEP